MKRISLILFSVAIAVSGLFTSCTEDEATEAMVSIKSSKDTTVKAGATFVISWDARKGTEKMKYVSIIKNGAIVADWNMKEIPSASDAAYADKATLTADPNVADYTYEIAVYDNNKTKLGSETVKVKVVAGAGLINTYSTVLMGGQNNATTGSFLATTTGTVYKVVDAKTAANSPKIDILYFYGDTKLASLASPDDADAATLSDLQLANFVTKNKTKFGSSAVTTTEFAAITDDAKLSTISGLTATKAAQLAVNNVIAFQTEAGKKGLILVKEILGTQGSDRAIKIEVKVQK